MAISDKRRNRLSKILGDRADWEKTPSTAHPGRRTFTKGNQKVVVGREGRIRERTRVGANAGETVSHFNQGRSKTETDTDAGKTDAKPRTGSEGRKWGAFVNTTENSRAGQRYNVVTRGGKQFNVYSDGTAVPTAGKTSDMARAKGYRDVNENTGRSGKAGGGRADWTPPTPAGQTPTTPAKPDDTARDAAWDERIKKAKQRRKSLGLN